MRTKLLFAATLLAFAGVASAQTFMVLPGPNNPGDTTVKQNETDVTLLEFQFQATDPASNPSAAIYRVIVTCDGIPAFEPVLNELRTHHFKVATLWRVTSGTPEPLRSVFPAQNAGGAIGVNGLLFKWDLPHARPVVHDGDILRVTVDLRPNAGMSFGQAGVNQMIQSRITDIPGQVGIAVTGATIGGADIVSGQLVIEPSLTIVPPGLGATEGAAYSGQFSLAFAAGPSSHYDWSVQGLPAGWSMDINGLMSAPSHAVVAGAYPILVSVVDIHGTSAEGSYTVHVNPPPTITMEKLPPAIEDEQYGGFLFPVSGGTGPFTWAATNLPPGWILGPGWFSAQSQHVHAGLNGTMVELTVTDKYGFSDTRSYDIEVLPAGSVAIITPSPLGATSHTALQRIFKAAGGVEPLTWSASGLPDGWSMSEAGTLSAAAPDVLVGTYEFTVSVSDGQMPPAEAQETFRLTVVPHGSPLAITTTGLVDAVLSEEYSATLGAMGGEPPYTWSSVTDLPPGFVLEANGTLWADASSSVVGEYAVHVMVTDSVGVQSDTVLGLTVLPPPELVIPATSLPGGTIGKHFEATITAGGGAAPYHWEVVDGSLPPGVELSANGTRTVTLVGLPEAAGRYSFTLAVNDFSEQEVDASFEILVAMFSPSAGGGGCAARSGGALVLILLLLLALLTLPALVRGGRDGAAA